MNMRVTESDVSASCTLEPLSEAYLDAAASLCDNCVGKNLYSRAYLASVIGKPNHSFYLLVTPEQEAVGYIYFFLTDLASMASLSKLPVEHLSVISQKPNPVIGNLQSIGVSEPFRGQGLSQLLIRLFLEQLQLQSADSAFGVFWKVDGTAPMEKTLTAFQFLHLADSHRVWYDNKDLICPFCNGQCECDAAIYYKPLGRGQSIETKAST